MLQPLHQFIDETLRKLNRAEIGVCLVLCRLAGEDGTVRDVPQWQIAHRVGCDARTVQRAIGALKKGGLLKVKRLGPGERSEYHVAFWQTAVAAGRESTAPVS